MLRSLCLSIGALMALTLPACIGDDPVASGTTTGADAGVSPPGEDASASPPLTGTPAERDAGPGVVTGPPEPPIASPDAWLDARKLTKSSITTWPDSSTAGADAISKLPHAVDPVILGGRPGVVFEGKDDQSFDIPAIKVPGFQVDGATHGFTIFVLALYDSAPQTDALLVGREVFGGNEATGAQLGLNRALAKVEARLLSHGASQVDTLAAGPAPSAGAPHLYVFRGQDDSATLRVDGVLMETTTGFEENGFVTNTEQPIMIGGLSDSSGSSGAGLVGAIGMVAVYTHALSDTQIQAGEQTAMKAWGIP